MEKRVDLGGSVSPSVGIGSKYLDLKKSFKFAIHSLLTAFSKEEAFPKFTNAERECLYHLFIQVRTTLDAVEQLVEQQDLDALFQISRGT
ncbi:Embryo defective protein [Quillaja saponaria]|uniref:Embryo defective protein n=1 Tax=Quillaja saponaria TaxID=32244 RepID=A0AAD7KQW5_QUISA|nr:Embryo defective protein [Quillaja saponaria]